MDTVNRRIHFFRADLGMSESGGQVPLNFDEIREALKKLPWVPGGRYVEQKNGNLTFAITLPKGQSGVVLGLSRRSDLPQLEKDGKTEPLDISDNSGVAELTHFRFFAKNIVACEYNHFGPRASRLSEYLAKALPTLPKFTLEPLLRRDITERLKDLKEVTLVDLKMRASTADDWLGKSDSLSEALHSLESSGQTDAIQLVLKAPKKQSLGAQWKARLDKFLKKPKLVEETDRLIAKGVMRDGSKEVIDLLSDRLISTQSVAKLSKRSKAILSSDMMRVMLEVYEDLRSQLEAAASLDLDED